MERMKTLQKDAQIFQEIKDSEEQRFKEELDLLEKEAQDGKIGERKGACQII